MKKTRLLIILNLIYLFLGCSAIINPSDSEINVKQGTTDLVNGSGQFDFGSIQQNKTKTVSFTIENPGVDPLVLTSDPLIQIVGQDIDDFSVDLSMTDKIIVPASSTTFSIGFDPQELGERTAIVSIKNNDRDRNPYTFTVTGTATTYSAMNLKNGTTDIPHNTGVVTFPDTIVYEESSEITISIENTGLEILHLTGTPEITEIEGFISNNYILNTTATANSINPGESTTFGLTFNPNERHARNVTVKIQNSTTDTNPYVFTLEGNCLSPEVEVTQGSNVVQPEPTSGYEHHFGYETVGKTSDSLVFKIENKGKSDLKLTETPNFRAANYNFVLDTNSTISVIPPGSSTTFSVSFAPQAVGETSAILRFSTNDPFGLMYKLRFKGIGTNKQLPFVEGWIGGGSNGWKTTSGTVPAADYQSFKSQNGISVDHVGNIYVADTYNNRICKWDYSGNAIGWIGGGSNGWKLGNAPTSGRDYRSFNTPLSVHYKSGYLYIADWGNNRICKWNATNGVAMGWIGNRVSGWQTGNAPNNGRDDYNSFDHPGSVFVNDVGNILVADTSNQRISKWDKDGNPIGWIGGGSDGWKTSSGSVENTDLRSFWNPIGVSEDVDGNLYISDFYNSRISKWDKDGKAIGWIGGGSNGWKTTVAPSTFGTDYQSFQKPRNVFVNYWGFIFIADSENNRICKWDKNGNAIGWLGGGSDGWKTTNAPSASTDYNGFDLPHGICITSSDTIYVSDTANNRICKWQD